MQGYQGSITGAVDKQGLTRNTDVAGKGRHTGAGAAWDAVFYQVLGVTAFLGLDRAKQFRVAEDQDGGDPQRRLCAIRRQSPGDEDPVVSAQGLMSLPDN